MAPPLTYTLLLAVCATLADALFFLLAEATFQAFARHVEGLGLVEGRLRDLYRIRAMSQFVRGERFVLAVVAFVVLLVVWLARLRIKWGDVGSRKFVCTSPLTADGEDESHTTTFYRLTSGGWKSDHLAAEYENWAVIFALFAIVLLPLARQLSFFDDILKSVIETTTGLFEPSASGGGDGKGVLGQKGIIQESAPTWRPNQSRAAILATVQLCGLGAVIVGILGQAGMAAWFGTAWAQSIIGFHPRHRTVYDTVELYDALFNQCLATGAVAMATCGRGGADQRPTGARHPTQVFYGIWFIVTLLAAAAAPVHGRDTHRGRGLQEVFLGRDRDEGKGDWDWENARAESTALRTVTYVIAVLLIVIGVAVLLFFLLFRICKTGKNGNEELILSEDTERAAVAEKVNSATTDNKGRLILNTSAGLSTVVVGGFGVNGASVPRKRPGAGPQLSFTGISRGSGRAMTAAGASFEAVPSTQTGTGALGGAARGAGGAGHAQRAAAGRLAALRRANTCKE